MRTITTSDAAKAVVRRNTEEVQGKGRFDIFEELFADDFVDHTPQPNMTPDKAGVRKLYGYIRHAFPDFHPKIHWQLADGDRVITYKTYYGTHEGDFLGIAPTHRKIHFETVDVMRVRDGKITDHWGVGNLFSLMQQLGVLKPLIQLRETKSERNKMSNTKSNGKVAFITGGNRGLGLETARELGKQGIVVVLGSRDSKKGDAAAAKLRDEGHHRGKPGL